MTAPAKKLRQFLRDYKAALRAAATQALTEPLPPLTEELFALYERTGSRLEYENAYFARRKALAVLGLCAVLEQRETGKLPAQLLQGLCGVLRAVCAEECWALPAHVNRAADPDWRLTVDLFAAETAQTLAELIDRLGPVLPGPLAAQITGEVERRVLRPYLGRPVPYGNWEFAANNWNAVCAGAIGSACLHLLRGRAARPQSPESSEFLKRGLDRVCASLPRYLDSFSADGVCLEGLTYYTYGMAYFVNFAQELREYDLAAGNTGRDLLCGVWGVEKQNRAGESGQAADTGPRGGMGGATGGAGLATGSKSTGDEPASPSDREKLARIAAFLPKCFFADGKTINFSDAFDNERFRVGLACGLSMRFAGLALPELSRAAGLHSDPCYRFAALRMDLLTTEQFLAELEAGAQQPLESVEKHGMGLLSENGPESSRKNTAEEQRANFSGIKKPPPTGQKKHAEQVRQAGSPPPFISCPPPSGVSGGQRKAGAASGSPARAARTTTHTTTTISGILSMRQTG